LIESLNEVERLNMKTITTDELLKKIDAGEQVNIIDVREQEEVDAGIIPGAKHIALGQVETSLDQIDPSVPHYIICKAGGRSAMACEILEENGYDVTNVTGGMMAWDGEVQF
jgi:rhodanese-related sulfurtransferase